MATKICSICKKDKDLNTYTFREKGLRRSECKACQRERRQKRIERDPESYKKQRRNQALKFLYGLSLNAYATMLEEQNDVCYICNKESKEPLLVDHNHRDGKVRKLLCRACNTGLGCFQDDPDLLHLAMNYLKEHE